MSDSVKAVTAYYQYVIKQRELLADVMPPPTRFSRPSFLPSSYGNPGDSQS